VESDVEHEDDRLLSLFMDYLPSNLQLVIRDHPAGMPLSLIQIYAKQLLHGLAHLSSQKVVHRDLLPRNILIDPLNQTLKVADFGCAKIVRPDVPNHPKVGTFQYRAMELLLGATMYDGKAGKAFNSVLTRRYLVGRSGNIGNDIGEVSICSNIGGEYASEYSHCSRTYHHGTSSRYRC
jgi:serine/threonine protein kinase